MVSITWQALWDELRAEVDDKDIVYATVKRLEEVEKGDSVDLTFQDGTKENFDLVFGADGVRSVARKAILGDESHAQYTYVNPVCQPSMRCQASRGTTHINQGLILGSWVYSVGGYMPDSLFPRPANPKPHLPWPQSHTAMAIGPEGFFGYSPLSPAATSSSGKEQRAMWWSTSSRKSHATQDADVDPTALRADLLQRHQQWPDPTVRRILENTEVSVRVAT